MKKIFIVLTIFMIILLTGCGLTEGTVINKGHDDAYTTTGFIPVSTGKTVSMIPTTQYHPEEWWVEIQKGKDKDTWDVSENEYNNIKIGDYLKSK